jgi:elongator complex protein 5
MAPSPLQQRRMHNTLLFQKLLNLREHGTSPFTLVLDSLEQSGGPLIREFARRGRVRASSFVSSRSIACGSRRVDCSV